MQTIVHYRKHWWYRKHWSIIWNSSLDSESTKPLLAFNHADRLLTTEFKPEKICMMPSTGRIYHPGPEKTGGIGLLGDKLGILWTAVRKP